MITDSDPEHKRRTQIQSMRDKGKSRADTNPENHGDAKQGVGSDMNLKFECAEGIMGTIDEGPTSCQIQDRLFKSQSLAKDEHKQRGKSTCRV